MRDSDQMDMKLRQFLLILLDDLSNLDRYRLHFVLGKQIPRRLRELKDIENTIQIFEYLIDTEKIFNCLIEALSACGRIDWSEKLKEFKQTYSLPITHTLQQSQTTKTFTQSVLDDISDEEEDICVS